MDLLFSPDIQFQGHICYVVLLFWYTITDSNGICIARFAIDKMQSVFLDEFGGEKTAPPRYQETSFVQHIFGGCLQSQVACTVQSLCSAV